MKKLEIIISSSQGKDTVSEVQTIEITHLAARELTLDELASANTSSPGVVILIPQSGSFSLSFGAKTRLMVPGLAYLLSGSEQSLPNVSPGDEDEPPEVSLRMIELNGVIDGTFLLPELLYLPSTLTAVECDEADRIFTQLAARHERLTLKRGGVDLAQHTLAARLVVLLLAAAGSTRLAELRTGKQDDVTRLKQLMMERLYANPSIPELAECMGMSRPAFYRWATPALGESPASYMRKLRLQKSQELLYNTSLTVEDIALRTGFCSRYHLERHFGEYFGMTPVAMRSAARSRSGADPANRVDRLIRDHRFDEAMQACEAGLKRTRETMSRERLQYQKARCFHAMGRVGEAVSAWQSLKTSAWAFEAGNQLCNHYFRMGKHNEAVSTLADLYEQGTHGQKDEVILLWHHQVARLANRGAAQPLSRYLDMRAELFPDNLRTMPLTATVLRGLGRPDLVLRQCAPMRELCFSALRQSGQYRQAIEQYGADMPKSKIVGTLVQAGQFEEAMALAPDDPGVMANSLTRLGRAEEAIRRFPDQAIEAFFILGRYQELLDRWPNHTEYHLWALRALDRIEELRNYPKPATWQWRRAQYLAGPDHAMQALSPSDGGVYQEALLWQALRHLNGKEPDPARACLDKIPLIGRPPIWWGSGMYRTILLGACTRGLCGQRDIMRTELETIREHGRYVAMQSLWHDAAFLLCTITEPQYRNQPCQVYLEERMGVMKAIRHDLNGEPGQAAESYRSFIANHAFRKKLLQEPELQEFMTWRLASLIDS